MKRINSLLALTFLSSHLFAQDKISFRTRENIYIGLDVMQSIPSYVLNKRYFIQNTLILEPVLLIPGKKARKSFVISPGFTTGSTNKNSREFISYEKFHGAYFKFSFESENRSAPMTIGFGPVISFATFKGRYKFEGPVFGDYEGDFKDAGNVAAGINGYVSYNAKLHQKLFLRVFLQGTVSARKGTINPFYYPGLGFTNGNGTIMFSPGFSAQLFYKLR